MSIEVKNELSATPCGGAGEKFMMVELEKKDGDRNAPLPSDEPFPKYDTATLFAGRREIVIRHAGAEYRMKITKQGKLILNK
jgi:hemin uptake protein HemP